MLHTSMYENIDDRKPAVATARSCRLTKVSIDFAWLENVISICLHLLRFSVSQSSQMQNQLLSCSVLTLSNDMEPLSLSFVFFSQRQLLSVYSFVWKKKSRGEDCYIGTMSELLPVGPGVYMPTYLIYP